MRNLILLISISSLFVSCVPAIHVRNERYIKNNIQQRSDNMDNIKLYNIDNGRIAPLGADISIYELTGFDYKNKKGLVIGIGMSEISGVSNNVVIYSYKIEHVLLSIEDCNKILAEYKNLIDQTKKTKTVYGMAYYSDLKINENVYISYQLRNGNINLPTNIDIWVNEKKMILHSANFIKKIEAFLKK